MESSERKGLFTKSKRYTEVEKNWYILIFHLVTMVVEAFLPSVNQSIEIGVEEIRVQVAEPLNDDFLNFGIGSEMAACLMLLQRSEEMKITWCEIWL
ncbi:hypothetical protein AVEN_210096-1 [Araneus ventricosus]|uniref:Uncharacterized protein n=1 Tax=Araneus ventricosus TaxID=182803 RepID=A0A4Y2G9W0_ARAVE|nr:hypothetical protein AVEN_210096-1 [Araneus ventricosus]